MKVNELPSCRSSKCSCTKFYRNIPNYTDGTAFVSLFLTVKRCVLYAKHLTVAERSNKKPKSGFDTHVTISINLSQRKKWLLTSDGITFCGIFFTLCCLYGSLNYFKNFIYCNIHWQNFIVLVSVCSTEILKYRHLFSQSSHLSLYGRLIHYPNNPFYQPGIEKNNQILSQIEPNDYRLECQFLNRKKWTIVMNMVKQFQHLRIFR